MGEYALLNGRSIKIGTCEDMYYLRADQAHLVRAQAGSVNPMNPKHRAEIRFRFPFPNEDNIQPGGFEPFTSWEVPGLEIPKDVHHYTVQISTNNRDNGGHFWTSIPCPFGKEALPSLTFHANGMMPWPRICQQREIEGKLWTVLQCPACGSKWRIDAKDAEHVAVLLRSHADKQDKGNASFWHTMADRMLAGYGINATQP